MGLLTLDVTELGVVMTSDSQPIEIVSGAINIVEAEFRRRDKIIEHHSSDFDGLIGYVGTEEIGASLTRTFLAHLSANAVGLSLDDFCERLQHELSAAWVTHDLTSALWVFVAGTERGELRFRYLVNADMLGHLYVNVSTGFRLVDDLDSVVIPRAMAETGATTKAAAMRGRLFFFRNGALLPAAMLFDSFTRLMEDVYGGGFDNFERVSSLGHYGALVRMRQEFIKRMFEPSKGLYSGEIPPIGGTIYVRSVDLEGVIRDHGKNA